MQLVHHHFNHSSIETKGELGHIAEALAYSRKFLKYLRAISVLRGNAK